MYINFYDKKFGASTPVVFKEPSTKTKMEAINELVPDASYELEQELLTYIDERIKEIHCAVLAPNVKAVCDILESHGVIIPKNKSIIINQYDKVVVLPVFPFPN